MITLKKIETKKEREELKPFYMAYLNELSRYKIFDESFEVIANEMCIAEDHRDDMFIMLDDKPIGFAMIGSYPNSFTDEDIYIQEFFIKGEYQNKGYGRQAVKCIEDKYKYKDISLFIIKTNQKAIDFWPSALNEIDYFSRLEEGGIKACSCDYDMIWDYYRKS